MEGGRDTQQGWREGGGTKWEVGGGEGGGRGHGRGLAVRRRARNEGGKGSP